MGRYRVLLLIFGALSLITSCATGPAFDASPKPELMPGRAILFIYRSGPTVFPPSFTIGTDTVAYLGYSGFTWVSLEPGVFEFGVKGTMQGSPTLYFEEKIEANKTYYLSIDVSGIGTSANFVSESEGKANLKEMKYVAAAPKSYKPRIPTK